MNAETTVVWNRGLPFKEVDGPWGKTLFVAPQRLVSLMGLLAAAMLGLFSWVMRKALDSIFLAAVFGLSGLAVLIAALRAVWTQVALELDHERREISLVRKYPWGIRRTGRPFGSVRSVSVEIGPGSESRASNRVVEVFLNQEEGTKVLLARADRAEAASFARRIAGLIGVAVATVEPRQS